MLNIKKSNPIESEKITHITTIDGVKEEADQLDIYLESRRDSLDIVIDGYSAFALLEYYHDSQQAIKSMSSEIAELKDINAGQSQFLDSLEHTLSDHGFLLINTKDENLKNELRKVIREIKE